MLFFLPLFSTRICNRTGLLLALPSIQIGSGSLARSALAFERSWARKIVSGGTFLQAGGKSGGRRGSQKMRPEAMVIREKSSPGSLVLQGTIVTTTTDTKPPLPPFSPPSSRSPTSTLTSLVACSYS